MGYCGASACNDPHCDPSTPHGYNIKWHGSVSNFKTAQLVAGSVSSSISRGNESLEDKLNNIVKKLNVMGKKYDALQKKYTELRQKDG